MIHQFNNNYNKPRYWIEENEGVAELCRRADIEDYYSDDKWVADQPKLECDNFRLVYREVASGTNEVTLIATVLPTHIFVGNTLMFLLNGHICPNLTTLGSNISTRLINYFNSPC